MPTAQDDLRAGCARAQLAELAWVDAEGRPDLAVVVPFLLEGAPAVALTYARLDLARTVADSPRVALTLGTPAFLRGARPVAAVGRPELQEDPNGDRFCDQLLKQELAKYPPARRLADSLLLQREHWWYLPRLLIRVTRPEEVRRLEAPGAVAAVRGEEGLVVDGCDTDHAGDRLRLRRTALPDGPVAVLEHGGEVPELEFHWHRRLRGELHGDEVVVTERDETGVPTHRPGLIARWRDERRLERDCRAGLRAAGHD